MAEKTLNVRILNKIDTLENWNKSSLKIKEGEICLATVAASAGTSLTEPVVMAKIGTAEEKTFSELPWAFHAKASDVLAACKSEAALKTFVNGVIADAGIASSSAMEALADRVTTAEGEIDTLQADLNTAETGLKARMTTAEGAIAALDGLVGDKKVATQISEAIAALKLAETYAAKSLEKTVADHVADADVHVTTADKTTWNAALQASNVATGSANGTIAVKGVDVAVKGLGSAAFTEASAYDSKGSAEQALTDAKAYAKEYADGLAGNYDAKGAATTAESNAKAYAKEYADGLAGNYDAAGSAADALEEAKGYTDSEMTRLVGETPVSEQISGAITSANLGQYETKTDASAKLTTAKGYTDTEVAKVQGEVDALETYVGTIPEGATATNVVAYVQEKTSGIATEGAMTELGNRVGVVEGKVATIEGDYLKAADKTELEGKVTAEAERAAGIESGLRTDVDAIKGDYLKAADKKALQDQITANDGEIAALQGLVGDTAVATQITNVTNPLAARVKAVEDDYLKAADKTELQGNIDTVSAAVERLTNGVSAEEVDGVNDLIQYVKDHGTEVTGIKGDINANADAIDAIEKDYLKAADKTELANAVAAEKTRAEGIEGGLETRLQAVEAAVGESGSVADDIAGALAEAKKYTDDEVKELAEGAVATNAADIATLEGLVGDKKVSVQITDVTNPLAERIVELEKVDHSHANAEELAKFADGDKTKLDSAVQSVTAGTGLTATKTGTDVAIAFDENVTFIFDCGDAEVEA